MGEKLAAYPKGIDMTLAEKWSGTPPQTVMGGTGAVPFFQLGSGSKQRHNQAHPSRTVPFGWGLPSH